MKIVLALAACIATLVMVTQDASAQERWQRRGSPPQDYGQQRQAPPQSQQGGGACIPSGFARLSRNCSANVGGCQRMPESCNRGWCCP